MLFSHVLLRKTCRTFRGSLLSSSRYTILMFKTSDTYYVEGWLSLFSGDTAPLYAFDLVFLLRFRPYGRKRRRKSHTDTSGDKLHINTDGRQTEK